MELGWLLAVLLIISLVMVGLAFWIKSTLNSWQQTQLPAIVDRIFADNATKVAQLSREVLKAETDGVRQELSSQQKSVQRAIDQLHENLNERQKELRSVDKQWVDSFARLRQQLEQHEQSAVDLKASTTRLLGLLENHQQRGAWGERIIQDILKATGLMEGIHYVTQQPLIGADDNLRPDVTLLLPDKRIIAVDVKFPMAHLEGALSSKKDAQQKQHEKQFAADMKDHITKVARYILPSAGTLDYALLFVPNELLFSYLNQECADLIDLALSKRVLLVSPFTFTAFTRMFMESYRTFQVSASLRGALDSLDGFFAEWQKYQTSVEQVGRHLNQTLTAYEELTGPRQRMLQKNLTKAQKLGRRSLKDAAPATADLPEKTL